ncbi:NAD(P)-dependent oxidoreductase [Curvibacter sp. HBC28]|uniref:NAD(P)-dependent oxidoreductase n=1 Tax=Curvibacter microcysteis TaxID=3026419 RepID=A0ABT5MB75_9BURK|nr:NAD(P)-dependent oxidoreductase [Curvibacter sp. HBC28]MDD0813164.1 NAD(P)-dependent oxidoreductase [Curvibacter sp. HBC28]
MGADQPLVVLNQLGEVTGRAIEALGPGLRVINDEHTPAWERAHEADVLLTAPRNGWRQAPKAPPAGWPGRLRWVQTASVGIDFFPPWIFDVAQVSCARGVAALPIAEYVFAALLAHNKALDTRWVQSSEAWRREFQRAEQQPLGLLHGQHLGLLGFGAIGRQVAQLALAFGMTVSALRRSDAGEFLPGVRRAESLAALLAESDHLVLALPITAETEGLLNAQTLAHARPGLHLVNIARGRLIDQEALLAALDSGRIGAATLDAVYPEPLPDGHRLYTHPAVRLSPHLSWSAGEVQQVTSAKVLDNLRRWLAGQPLLDVVDPAVGY